jgi:hypothetical protein
MFSLARLSQRTLFAVLMSGLATLFGSSLAARRIVGQADVLTDVIKIGGVIAVGTVVLSFIFWTVTHWRRKGSVRAPIRGAIAGLLTALCVIPLPVFAWKLKSDVLAAYANDQTHFIAAFFEALPGAIGTGLLTFEVMTKASLIAMILSVGLGYSVSRWGPDRAV